VVQLQDSMIMDFMAGGWSHRPDDVPEILQIQAKEGSFVAKEETLGVALLFWLTKMAGVSCVPESTEGVTASQLAKASTCLDVIEQSICWIE
jgi:hypothetical protein